MEKSPVRYLVRRPTREVFIWNEILAKRKDLEEVFAENVEAALNNEPMPDPKGVSIDELEAMKKSDLILFAEVKLGLKLSAADSKEVLLDQVKEAIFTRDAPAEGAMTVPTVDKMDAPRARSI